MSQLQLKDGSFREFTPGQSAAEIVKGIGMGLYKAACCVKINGEVCDLRTPVTEDCTFEVCTFDDPDGKKTFWHTASHVLAQAVKRLYPNAKLAIGPAIDSGFYYDFDVEKPFTAEELRKIEAEMKKIVKENAELEQFTLSPDEAISFLKEQDEPYKVELCEEHAGKGEPISFYRQGEFTDLCAGPHLMKTGVIKAFKLLSCTGAYWRGSEKNKMLSRVYAIAFPKASMLDEHLKQLEEAKMRDHNKLGRELEYFTTVDVVGQGLPILLPKGARVVQLLQRWVEDVEQSKGCLLTKTPLMAKREFYKISGHWDHYLDGMFILGDPYDETKECFALRPMTCPFQYQVYLNRARSYRDLPMRLVETSTLFRNEDSGEMHGLIRVRQFTISEGHYILRPDQLEEEFKGCLELAKYFLDTVGLLDDCTFLSGIRQTRTTSTKVQRNSGKKHSVLWATSSTTSVWITPSVLTKLPSMVRSWIFSIRMFTARKTHLLPFRLICCWLSGLVCITPIQTDRRSCRISFTEPLWAAMNGLWHT